MAELTGLEPATSRVTGERSNQLNYGSIYMAAKRTVPSNKTVFRRAKILACSPVLVKDNTLEPSWQYQEPIKSGYGHISMHITHQIGQFHCSNLFRFSKTP